MTLIREFWPYLLFGINLVAAVLASSHAILYKRDSRSAVSWVGLIWFAPIFGAIFYISFGINRLERRAISLRRKRRRIELVSPSLECTVEELRTALAPDHLHLAPIAAVGRVLLGRPLLEGNAVLPLRNGEEAYPAMLAAIDAAQRSVSLLAYILELDEVGQKFLDALAKAVERGVEVRVLIDAVGSGKGRRRILRAFRERKVPIEVFLPLRVPWRTRFMNLRNHRKILVVDGRTGFTGGMNIRASHLVQGTSIHKERDLHFRLEGPVVEHLQEAFVDDWSFTTGESLLGDRWFPAQTSRGTVNARGVPFDPGLKLDTFRSLLVAAVGAAQRSIRIVTPYFLPESPLITALNVAAMRGVEVDILIPECGDNPVVDWATQSLLWQLLGNGCRVWRTPPPFEHTKVLVVDGVWTFFGSMNVDPRSLRLNFEFNVESFDKELGARLEAVALELRGVSKQVTLKQVNGRSLPVRLRDGIARLFTPYL